MIWYVYPQWHKVSFTIISEKHIQYLKRRVRLHAIDELAFPQIFPSSRPLVILHPTFYPLSNYGRIIEKRLHMYRGIIGIDVADSDHISALAVSMTNYTNAMIVPSTFAKEAYLRSGVTVPLYVVPHGLDMEWYETPRLEARTLYELRELKKKGYKILLTFIIHSEYRKGADLVIEFYRRMREERKDIILVVKTLTEEGILQPIIRKIGGVIIAGWLTEEQKMELYDQADLYLLFSRGGGFEHNGLEALARLVPVIAAKGGSWEDYMPRRLLVDSHKCDYVLKDNPIHDGRGVEIDIEKAVDKALDVLDNIDEWRARLDEWRKKVLKPTFNWRHISDMLLQIIKDYYTS